MIKHTEKTKKRTTILPIVKELEHEMEMLKNQMADLVSQPAFVPAISIEEFKELGNCKNGPTYPGKANWNQYCFEWVNPDEVEAGGTTCGFLIAPFWCELVYPTVKSCAYTQMFVLSMNIL